VTFAWACGVQIPAVNVWVAIVLAAVNKKLSSNIAFCSVISALCVVLMILCRVVSITDYAISALCGLLVGITVIESGKKWALSTYIVVSILGLLLGSNECAVTFVVFLGYYPIIKVWLDKLNKFLGYLIKLSLFNFMIIGAYLALDYLGFIPLDEIEILGNLTNVIVLLMANIVFVIYDFVFNGIMAQYFARLHSKITKILKK